MSDGWKVSSELLEPLLTGTIGLLWDECDKAGGFKNIDALKVFWHKIDALNTLVVVNGAPHASIAMNNAAYKAACGIKAATGQCPYRDKW